MINTKEREILERYDLEMENKLAKLHEEMRGYMTFGKSSNGLVEARLDINGQVKDIKIDPTFLKEHPELIGQCVTEAINDATFKASVELEKQESLIVYDYLRKAITQIEKTNA